ncbi:MFS transporter [Terasakiispira papahanaumokuakeensis]|uniref:MFS transporter n=1 Tax=Terasakiispira papahanaumokuakeensis TaxID=197479 RepID=A0A1E2V8W0_9GAMM|nr:MFS transporter [Terasakiispira papahanaumokuakeensis]ODC03417.1 MFS transporter [Terasakiispira papahanaumokuakeensis]
MGAAKKFYHLVANEEDARTCQDIPDSDCHKIPGNFLRITLSLMLTKLADEISSAKTVLPWLMSLVGAPHALVACLVPIRESGSLLPQLAIGSWVREHPIRKYFWSLGSGAQGLCVIAMIIVALVLKGALAGFLILGLLIILSLARGLCSVSIKDVQGKTIPKNRRGRLTGLATTCSGILAIILSIGLLGGSHQLDTLSGMWLLGIAGCCWCVAALIFSRVNEQPGATEGGNHGLKTAFSRLKLIKEAPDFRGFVISRSLLLASALAAPYLMLLSQQDGHSISQLGGFLLASSLASALSASIWGWLADRSSRQVMLVAGMLAAVLCIGIAIIAMIADGWSSGLTSLIYPTAFFILSVAHAGIRIGRKTYLTNMAEGNRRTDYVAVSNTLIGVVLLLMGGVTAALSSISIALTLIVLGAMALTGCIMTYHLAEVE